MCFAVFDVVDPDPTRWRVGVDLGQQVVRFNPCDGQQVERADLETRFDRETAIAMGEEVERSLHLLEPCLPDSAAVAQPSGNGELEHGGAPRFGSCFLVLGSHVRRRATLSLGDSHLVPPDVGTFREPMGILAGLAEQEAQGRLLNRSLGRDSLAQVLRGGDRVSTVSRDLDGYVEAQVHGGVSLAADVDEVVLDPSFRGTGIERDLALAEKRYGFEIRWHSGSELHINDVPSDFRGPEMPEVAARVARPDELLDAHAIGVAAAKERFEEPTLLGDPPDAPLQQLKYLRHTSLAYGVAIA